MEKCLTPSQNQGKVQNGVSKINTNYTTISALETDVVMHLCWSTVHWEPAYHPAQKARQWRVWPNRKHNTPVTDSSLQATICLGSKRIVQPPRKPLRSPPTANLTFIIRNCLLPQAAQFLKRGLYPQARQHIGLLLPYTDVFSASFQLWLKAALVHSCSCRPKRNFAAVGCYRTLIGHHTKE